MSQPESDILQESIALRDSFQTLLMATVTPDGEPEASYTPYLFTQGRFYIFVSGLSSHTTNLQDTGKVSLLFIEDERDVRNLFARRRLSYQCTATPISREDARWTTLLDQFQERHGATVGLLRQLPDFVLFELKPVRGSFVKGFGQAYALEGEHLDQVRQITGK